MAYRLDPCQPTHAEIRRVGVDQLDAAISDLADPDRSDPPDAEAIHDARKRLKKTRSLVRLARADLGPECARQINRALRDAGRALSARRDADAMLETIQRLVDVTDDADVTEQLVLIGDWLRSQPSHLPPVGDTTDVVAGTLVEARDLLAAQRPDATGWDALESGVRREYRRGSDALDALRDDPSDERWHDWRKRAKDVWYQLRLLGDTWPQVMKATADQASQLSDLLGDDHDLAVLSTKLEGSPPPTDAARVHALIDAERGRLQSAATEIGRHLYADRPRIWARRIGVWWSLAER